MSEVPWPVLNMLERRILGVLIEKAKTTPEAYPLSLNALVTGCNQKSNRDPLLNVDDVQVEESLEGMQPKGLVIRVTGGRVDRWRHNCYEAWTQNKVELAVIAELLLRGPQTLGDLRGRASRMDAIESLDALRDVIKPLVERKLVLWLAPESRRGAMLTHGFHAPDELERLRSHHAAGTADEPAPSLRPAAPAHSTTPPDSRLAEVAELRTGMEQIRAELARLSAAVAALQRELGVNPPG